MYDMPTCSTILSYIMPNLSSTSTETARVSHSVGLESMVANPASPQRDRDGDQNVRNDLPSLKLIAKTPENRPSQKETIVFQPSIFRGELLVSGSVMPLTLVFQIPAAVNGLLGRLFGVQMSSPHVWCLEA